MNRTALVGVAAATVAAFALTTMLFRRRKQFVPPTKWRRVGKVIELILYPVKSCKGYKLAEGTCTPLGLTNSGQRDRVFMVVNDKLAPQTIRQHQKMVFISPSYNGENELWLDAPDMKTFKLPIPQDIDKIDASKKVPSVRLYGEKISNVIDCGDEVGKWFSKYLDDDESKGYRLLYHLSEVTSRRVQKSLTGNSLADNYPMLTDSDKGAFCDDVSYSVLSENSMEDLNSRMNGKVISYMNFRPSIMVRAEKAYEENEWKWLRIGDVIFKAAHPVSRCQVTTVNPDLGIKDPDQEPLTTLRTYRLATSPALKRLFGQSPLISAYFGLHCVHGVSPIIHEGDDIYVGMEEE